jgi:ATP-dependent helicase/nuclease subunit A
MNGQWTKEQQKAIKLQVPKLFVSASAGSGKTSTMVARIVELVKMGSASVGELLVLTFTRESARDMRAKLAAGFEDALSQINEQINDQFAAALHGRNGKTSKKKTERIRDNLIGQLLDLQSADIGTFHNFCGQTVRQWFTVAGVNPNFSIIDDSESYKIKSEVFDRVLADCYKGISKNVIDRFAVNRNFNTLRDTIFSLHNFLESREDQEKWLNDLNRIGFP